MKKWTLSALYLPSADHQLWLPVKVLQKTNRKLLGRKHYTCSLTAENIAHSMCKLRPMPQPTCILIYYQTQCESCTGRYMEDFPRCTKAVGTSSQRFRSCPGTACFCLHFCLGTLQGPFNSVHRVGPSLWHLGCHWDVSVKHRESILRPLRFSSYWQWSGQSVSSALRVSSCRWLGGRIEIS